MRRGGRGLRRGEGKGGIRGLRESERDEEPEQKGSSSAETKPVKNTSSTRPSGLVRLSLFPPLVAGVLVAESDAYRGQAPRRCPRAYVEIVQATLPRSPRSVDRSTAILTRRPPGGVSLQRWRSIGPWPEGGQVMTTIRVRDGLTLAIAWMRADVGSTEAFLRSSISDAPMSRPAAYSPRGTSTGPCGAVRCHPGPGKGLFSYVLPDSREDDRCNDKNRILEAMVHVGLTAGNPPSVGRSVYSYCRRTRHGARLPVDPWTGTPVNVRPDGATGPRRAPLSSCPPFPPAGCMARLGREGGGTSRNGW
jgi:hypothetical protein